MTDPFVSYTDNDSSSKPLERVDVGIGWAGTHSVDISSKMGNAFTVMVIGFRS